ncbi:hypothetical protein LguiA_031121 [Lonicera macranthoides]
MAASSTTPTMKDKTLTGIGNLIKLLPTGTVFMFQFLNPVLTNNGHCHLVNKYLSGALIAISAISCCFSSFTDSYTDSTGTTHYVVATKNGFWPASDSESDVDPKAYKLRVGDFVHSFFALVVFGVVSLLDTNTVECFYPSFESTERVVMMVLPTVIGAVAGTVFVVFPNTRHGIGYPSSSSSQSTSASST